MNEKLGFLLKKGSPNAGLGKPFLAVGQKKQERSYRVDRNVPVLVKCNAKVRRIPENGKYFFQGIK
jgi:hypothetical protein